MTRFRLSALQAICCDDKLHCCPAGTVCQKGGQKCANQDGSLVIKSLVKFPAVKRECDTSFGKFVPNKTFFSPNLSKFQIFLMNVCNDMFYTSLSVERNRSNFTSWRNISKNTLWLPWKLRIRNENIYYSSIHNKLPHNVLHDDILSVSQRAESQSELVWNLVIILTQS